MSLKLVSKYLVTHFVHVTLLCLLWGRNKFLALNLYMEIGW